MKRVNIQRTKMKCLIIKVNALLLYIFLSMATIAQTSISGRMVNGKLLPIARGNILLLQSKDSSLVKGTITGEDGTFALERIPEGKYVLSVSCAGFQPLYSQAFFLSNGQKKEFSDLTLAESILEMNVVTIVSRKPIYEQKSDRLIVNVQNSITSAGNTALDVLERSPGVVVNRQNNSISLKGKEGVVLMINGKKTYMPVAAAMELLEGMSSGNIEKIELITAPPANFDAEGNAGYINVIMKSNDRVGTNASISATLGYGKGWVTEANLNFNHRKGKFNLYGDFSYSRVVKPLPIDMHTKVSNHEVIQEMNFKGARTDSTRLLNARLGLDFQLTRKTVIGFLVNGYERKYNQTEINEVQFLKNSQLDTIVEQKNSELNLWQDLAVNLNMQHDFNPNQKLTVNLDYLYYTADQPFYYHSEYLEKSGDSLYSEDRLSTKSTPINIWIGALDYSQKFGKNLLIQGGLKGTTAHFFNDLGVKKLVQGNWVSDTSLSAKYTLNENYPAAYLSCDLNIGQHTKAKAGLRYEYTNTNLGSEEMKNIVDKHYGEFFPVFSFSQTLDERSTINLSYNKRITRPTFNNLAPYIYYLNNNTIMTGNPGLQPAVSQALELNYSLNKYSLSITLSKEDHAVAPFQPHVDSVSNKVVLYPENLGSQKLASLMISLPLSTAGWWTMQYSLNGIWQEVESNGNNPIRIHQWNYNIHATETFKLPKNFALELSGFYQSRRLDGIYTQSAYGSLDFGIRKKLTGAQGSLILSGTNLLNTADYHVSVDYPDRNLVSNLRIGFTQPTIKLTYIRSFGSSALRSQRERNTGAEDEKGRVQ
jgi:Outer membrane protein beta-barrel family/Carboxypeptidase regulatory-like domain